MNVSVLFRMCGLLCWLLCLGLAAPAHAQTAPTAILKQLEGAFSSGNVRSLLERAGDRVEIALFGESMLYSRAQAVYVMENFFQQYPPEAFAFQDPSTNAGSCFATGHYQHRHDGQELKVYVRLWHREKQWELREIRIDPRPRD